MQPAYHNILYCLRFIDQMGKPVFDLFYYCSIIEAILYTLTIARVCVCPNYPANEINVLSIKCL